MVIKYGADIQDVAIKVNLQRLTNQIYKLLPLREEEAEWQKPLETIMEELTGMDRLLIDHHSIFFPLLCKLEGLFELCDKDDFMLYRRSIFESIGLIAELQKKCL